MKMKSLSESESWSPLTPAERHKATGVNYHITHFLEKAVSDLERLGRARSPHANDCRGKSKMRCSIPVNT